MSVPRRMRSKSTKLAIAGRFAVDLGRLLVTTAFLASAILATQPAVAQGQGKSTIHVSGAVPPVPRDLEATIDRYRFSSSSDLQGWLADTRQILLLTASNGIPQPFVCSQPGEAPGQLAVTDRPVSWVYSDPRRQRVIIAQDNDGNEREWLTLLDLSTGAQQQFTNGRWENHGVVWSRSGRMLAMTSNAQNGKDGDLYVIDPAVPSTGRRLKEARGMMFAQSWSPDDRRLAAVENSPDWRKARVHLVDVETGQAETLPQPAGAPVKRMNVRWSADGREWISTQPDLDASRVAVRGGSHGGYLALAAMAQFGDRIRCGIDIAGFSDFETSLRDERASAIDYWRAECGDERDPETREFLRSISPLSRARDQKAAPGRARRKRPARQDRRGRADLLPSAAQRHDCLVRLVRRRRPQSSSTRALGLRDADPDSVLEDVLAAALTGAPVDTVRGTS